MINKSVYKLNSGFLMPAISLGTKSEANEE